MNLLASSDNYELMNEYESVYLFDKNTKKKGLLVADFYGDPTDAIISIDEKYCVVVGCGVVVYFLNKPYEQYEYSVNTEQWKEWGRSNRKKLIWVDSVKQKTERVIEIQTEDGCIVELDIYNLSECK